MGHGEMKKKLQYYAHTLFCPFHCISNPIPIPQSLTFLTIALEEELSQNQSTGSVVSDERSQSQVEELRTLHVQISELRAKASGQSTVS